MNPNFSDPLEGLTADQRKRKEREDAAFVQQHTIMYANAEARKVANMTFAGAVAKALDPKLLKPWSENTKEIAMVVCARLDLDHPLYYGDNLFCDCVDCGCNLQVGPHAPKGERVCICCAARRVAVDLAQPSDPDVD